ncbi:hypothetical protein AB9M62_06080 [Bacillales bacterium AN1005]
MKKKKSRGFISKFPLRYKYRVSNTKIKNISINFCVFELEVTKLKVKKGSKKNEKKSLIVLLAKFPELIRMLEGGFLATSNLNFIKDNKQRSINIDNIKR